MKKRVTLKDVAERAGVSTTIASRVLNNYGSFSEETKKKVLKSAEELGYQINRVAQALRAGTTKAIGVIVNSVTETFWMHLYRGIESTAQKYGYQVFLCNSDNGRSEKEQAFLKALAERGVDGIILSPALGTHNYLRKLHKNRMPIVLVDSKIEGMDVSSIIIDDAGGAFEAVEYLINLGHRRIAIITGCKDSSTSAYRLEGYKRALNLFGVQYDDRLVEIGEYLEEKAYEAVLKLLKKKMNFTALFTINESMTRGAVRALEDAGVEIPGEISLIGWDNPEWTGILRPKLTVVDAKPFDIGNIACQTLIDEIENRNEGHKKNITIKTELIKRESCRQID